MAVTVSQVIDVNDKNTKYLRSYDSIKSTSNLYWTREGYKFIGWNTEPDGTGTFYVDGAAIDFTEDITLYAMWQEDGSVDPPPVDPPDDPSVPSNSLQLMTGDNLELMSGEYLELNN